MRVLHFCLPVFVACSVSAAPHELRAWLDRPQNWVRTTDGPIVSLGQQGSFDDTHIFAPTIAQDRGKTLLWYCGSTGTVAGRVFKLGYAESPNGMEFSKSEQPIFAFGDDRRSVLTPTVLRDANGLPLRENGRLRMWFSAASFKDPSGLHTLHESFSEDGRTWTPPSDVLMKHVYAPSVIRIGKLYQMWYTDVSGPTWIIRHAWSRDGRKWYPTAEPSIVIDQDWEHQRLFYPHVVFHEGRYHMWYGSYWKKDGKRQSKTAIGYAASIDGMRWFKHEQNPVFMPDASRPWESHYVTSHSVLFNEEAREWRIYYASRKKPPFTNKYFAINTARWRYGYEAAKQQWNLSAPDPRFDKANFTEWQTKMRKELRDGLGIPQETIPLDPESRGSITHNGVIIEKWMLNLEPGSRAPAILYRPANPRREKLPAIVMTFGHGGSKSAWQYQYAGQLYAKLGLACLAIDPIGEEERHVTGRMGSRAHDPKPVHDRALKAGRMIMGKLVFDTMRGVDFLMSRDDINHSKIGVAGNSLGGAKAGWMAALEPRLRTALVCGWTFENIGLRTKYCTKAPNQFLRDRMSWADLLTLAAPQCSVLVMNGDADWVIDREDDKTGWSGSDRAVDQARRVFDAFGTRSTIESWYEKDGGHRPFFAYREAIDWINNHLGTPAYTSGQIKDLPTMNSGDYCDANRIPLERLYGTDLHQRGATLVDLGVQPLKREQLAVLKPEEMGQPEFTVEGWLEEIEK